MPLRAAAPPVSTMPSRDRVRQGLVDLAGFDGHGFRQAGDEVASGDVHGLAAGGLHGAADGDLDLLRGALADQEIVLAAQVADDGVVEIVAAQRNAGAEGDLVHGKDRDVRRAGAHVHDHAAVGLVKAHADAQGCGQGALQDLRPPHARVEHDGDQGALLDFVHAGGHRHHGPRAGEDMAANGVGDQVGDKGFHEVVVRDGALPEGPHRLNVPGCPADEPVSVAAHGQNAVQIAIHRHNRRFAEDNPATA